MLMTKIYHDPGLDKLHDQKTMLIYWLSLYPGFTQQHFWMSYKGIKDGLVAEIIYIHFTKWMNKSVHHFSYSQELWQVLKWT